MLGTYISLYTKILCALFFSKLWDQKMLKIYLIVGIWNRPTREYSEQYTVKTSIRPSIILATGLPGLYFYRMTVKTNTRATVIAIRYLSIRGNFVRPLLTYVILRFENNITKFLDQWRPMNFIRWYDRCVHKQISTKLLILVSMPYAHHSQMIKWEVFIR